MTKDANICPAGDFLKTNLTKFVVIWSEKESIGMFLWTRSKLTLTKEKEMRKGKSKEEETKTKEKAMIALVVFIMATLQTVLGRKKLLGTKGPFGGNVFKSHTGQAAFLPSLSCTLVGRIEHIQSRDQKLRYKFIGAKLTFNKRKGFNSHRIGHQHGRRFIVLGLQ